MDALENLKPGGKGRDRLVALEYAPASGEMVLFVRDGDQVSQVRDAFEPFLWIRDLELVRSCGEGGDAHELQGGNPFRWKVSFPTWKAFGQCLAALKKKGHSPGDPNSAVFAVNDPVQQYLMLTGQSLFAGMKFDQVRRLQVDIETYTDGPFEFSNAAREGDRIIAIALADETGWVEVLSGADLSEPELLTEFVARIQTRNPDVMEGHNLFNFDLPYLMERARRHGIKLALGRDGSAPQSRPSRFVAADRTIAYSRAAIFGRHVLDTYFMALSYDVSHRELESHGLKDLAIHLGVAESGRTYIEGRDISAAFDQSPKKLMAYARDDIVETRAVSGLLSPTYFIQAQILPFSYQSVCVKGSGSKIDALLLREYLHRSRSIPAPDAPRAFEGGYADIFVTGLTGPVHHCDVRSLYPSIMLKDNIRPRSDELEVFTQQLAALRQMRMKARQDMVEARDPSEKRHFDALQSALKILINSFYGYLGFNQARFSDFSAAERVAAEGRAILTHMVEWIRRHGGRPVEIDTDGIYFNPPPSESTQEKERFRLEFQQSLPDGIDVEFDGEYSAMYSYKMKNYALLADRSELIIKGAALKSRGLEPFQRQFLREWLRLTLEGKASEIPILYRSNREAIEKRLWPIAMLAKTETLQESPAAYQAKIQGKNRGRNAAYELALRSGRDYQAGDRVSYYVTGDRKTVAAHSNARLAAEWNSANRDENVPYYLAKLDALLQKFDPAQQPVDNDRQMSLLDTAKECKEGEKDGMAE